MHESLHVEIRIAWIPLHVGITGNEIADKFANDGLLQTENDFKDTSPSVMQSNPQFSRDLHANTT